MKVAGSASKAVGKRRTATSALDPTEAAHTLQRSRRNSPFGEVPPVRKPGETLGDFAYRTMRQAIRAGRFLSGDHIREADVARWLRISRTPVREAFRRILSGGLFESGPWNGMIVAEID